MYGKPNYMGCHLGNTYIYVYFWIKHLRKILKGDQ